MQAWTTIFDNPILSALRTVCPLPGPNRPLDTD